MPPQLPTRVAYAQIGNAKPSGSYTAIPLEGLSEALASRLVIRSAAVCAAESKKIMIGRVCGTSREE